MRVVLDTNVLVAGLLSPFGPCGEIVRMLSAADIEPCLDARILDEYRQVLSRPRFAFDQEKVGHLMGHVREVGVIVPTRPLAAPLPDPDDEPFLQVALAAEADCIVTGNRKHFPSDRCEGVTVVSPSSFLALWVRVRPA